jgi:hypothetical protein
MNQASHSKDLALDMSQGQYLLLNALFHLAFRFSSGDPASVVNIGAGNGLKKTIQELLQ